MRGSSQRGDYIEGSARLQKQHMGKSLSLASARNLQGTAGKERKGRITLSPAGLVVCYLQAEALEDQRTQKQREEEKGFKSCSKKQG